MRSVSFQLSEKDKENLKQEAEKKGISQAGVIRMYLRSLGVKE